MMTSQQLISDYCLKLIKIDVEEWYMNAEFKIVLEPIFHQCADDLHLVFDASIQATLASNTPPLIDFFLSLSTPQRGTWGVYVLVFVDLDGKHHLYVGSGTDAISGVAKRMRQYADKTHGTLPRFVRQGYDNGFELLHMGILCSTNLPHPTQVPRARLLFLCLEAAFTCMFYSAFYTVMEPLWSHMMPWTRDLVTWSPLNSHLPFTEGVGDSLNLTPQQLQTLAVIRKEKQRNTSMASYNREREMDLEGHLLRKRTEKAAWVAKNKDRVAATHANTVAKIKSAGSFRCDDCSISLQSSTALASHLKTKKHAQQLAFNLDGVRTPPSRDALRTREHYDKNRAEKKFHCSICDHSAAGPKRLENHKASKHHLKKVAAALASISSI